MNPSCRRSALTCVDQTAGKGAKPRAETRILLFIYLLLANAYLIIQRSKNLRDCFYMVKTKISFIQFYTIQSIFILH